MAKKARGERVSNHWSSKPEEVPERDPREVRFLCSTEGVAAAEPPADSPNRDNTTRNSHDGPHEKVFARQPPKVAARRRIPASVRFWRHVVHTESCWLWQGGKTECGYGLFKPTHVNRTMLAHRWAYEALKGPIPDGLDLDHVAARGCTHRHCVNPAHLEPVTRRENHRRRRKAVAR